MYHFSKFNHYQTTSCLKIIKLHFNYITDLLLTFNVQWLDRECKCCQAKQNEWDSGPQCSLCRAFIDFERLNALSKKQFIVNVIRLCSSQIWQQAYLQNKFMLYKITKYGCHSSSIAGQKHSSLYFYPCYKFMIWFSQNYIFHT